VQKNTTVKIEEYLKFSILLYMLLVGNGFICNKNTEICTYICKCNYKICAKNIQICGGKNLKKSDYYY
jgi:hypothetical protein